MRFSVLCSRLFSGLLLAVLLAGCSSSGPKTTNATSTPSGHKTSSSNPLADALRKGDLVQIVFSGIPNPPPAIEERIKEDGTLNLSLVGSIKAEDKTPGVLQKEIEDLYVPKFFRRLTVTVKTERRVFFVDGEVRRPDRFVYEGAITLLQAVAAAQGFTDFAAKGRIELVRSTGERLIIDARKAKENTELDVPIVPGDRIFVPRRSPFGR